MQLTINGKEYELNFGVRFVREMDKNMYDAAVLADTIYSATVTSKKRPSANEVDDFIDSNSDLDSLFKQVANEMNSANAVKAVAKNMKA